jgi:hypothetical protein
MIILKITALSILGVGTIAGLLSSQLGPDLVIGLFAGIL